MEVVHQPCTAAAVSQAADPRHPPLILCIDQRTPGALGSQCGDLQSLALQKELETPSTIDLPAQHSELLTLINSENQAQFLRPWSPSSAESGLGPSCIHMTTSAGLLEMLSAVP